MNTVQAICLAVLLWAVVNMGISAIYDACFVMGKHERSRMVGMKPLAIVLAPAYIIKCRRHGYETVGDKVWGRQDW